VGISAANKGNKQGKKGQAFVEAGRMIGERMVISIPGKEHSYVQNIQGRQQPAGKEREAPARKEKKKASITA